MGLGEFGGGEAVVRFLVRRGAIVTLTDLKTESQLAVPLQRLTDEFPAKLRLGQHDLDDFTDADGVVVNPAVKPDNPFVQAAERANVPLTSEIRLFWTNCTAPILGITGTAGKSTTATLVRSLMQAAGIPCRLGGNIGHSLLNELDSLGQAWVILELSSFQLTDLDRGHFSPRIAVVTNFYPNHLDWHPDLADYRHAKQTILRWQSADDVAVVPADDAEVVSWIPRDSSRRVISIGPEGDVKWTGDELRWGAEYRVRFPELWPGTICRNAALALGAVLAVHPQMDASAVARGLQNFRPLPHRLQFVGEVAGRRFYDDSKATTPEASIAAINAFSRPIVLMAGGADKGVDLSDFAAAISHRVKAVALMGQTAESLSSKIASVPQHCGTSFAECFAWAWKQSRPDDIVLLSPGCSSLDWFRNYVDRGEQFQELVARPSWP